MVENKLPQDGLRIVGLIKRQARNRKTVEQTDRQTGEQVDRQMGWWASRQTDRWIGRQADKQTDRYRWRVERQTDRQMSGQGRNMQTSGQTDRQVDR